MPLQQSLTSLAVKSSMPLASSLARGALSIARWSDANIGFMPLFVTGIDIAVSAMDRQIFAAISGRKDTITKNQRIRTKSIQRCWLNVDGRSGLMTGCILKLICPIPQKETR